MRFDREADGKNISYTLSEQGWKVCPLYDPKSLDGNWHFYQLVVD